MRPSSAHENKQPILSQGLLLNIAEELKLPLIQIARLAEQAQRQGAEASSRTIRSTADMALQLLDSYILGVKLSLEPQLFDQESVSVSSVLYNAAQRLEALASNYGVNLELSISGRFGPVTANKYGLEAALTSLGAALIEALPAMDNTQLNLQLATHRSRYGIVAGVYADTKQLSAQVLSSGRKLQHTTRQPLVNLSHTSGAGVFVADTILKAMDLNLISSRHHRLYGLGTILKPNYQMQLIT